MYERIRERKKNRLQRKKDEPDGRKWTRRKKGRR